MLINSFKTLLQAQSGQWVPNGWNAGSSNPRLGHKTILKAAVGIISLLNQTTLLFQFLKYYVSLHQSNRVLKARDVTSGI